MIFKSYILLFQTTSGTQPHIQRKGIRLSLTDQSGALKAEENARDISQEHDISQMLTDLGVEESMRSEWVRVLTWMKPELVAAPIVFTKTYSSIRIATSSSPTTHPHYSLCYVPILKKIKYERSNIVDDIIRRNNYGLLPRLHLEKLREVVLVPTTHFIQGDTRFYIHLDILRMPQLFHQLPAIESVATNGVGQNYDGDLLRRFPPTTSNLKRIHVGHSMYGEDVIVSLTRAPKFLEELTLTIGGHSTNNGGYSVVSAKTIGQALFIHKTSLRKVDIDLDCCLDEIGYDDCDDCDDEEKKKKKRKKKKKMLAESLPKSLDYLLIRGYERGRVAQHDSPIDELLLTREARLPSLRELHGINETIPSAAPIERSDEDGNWRREFPDEEWEEETNGNEHI
ncbi:hypothetical protein RRF57_001909 [Xylaria bambusicola]|uniref:Uncharacterized protein n=1 Tax=Xylaria bambusicola TaxID=326684 RepID=A0AAN7URT6_9PEZI